MDGPAGSLGSSGRSTASAVAVETGRSRPNTRVTRITALSIEPATVWAAHDGAACDGAVLNSRRVRGATRVLRPSYQATNRGVTCRQLLAITQPWRSGAEPDHSPVPGPQDTIAHPGLRSGEIYARSMLMLSYTTRMAAGTGTMAGPERHHDSAYSASAGLSRQYRSP